MPGSTGVERGIIDKAGTSAARELADQVVNDIRGRVVPQLEELLSWQDTPSGEVVSQRLGEPYAFMKGDYLDELVDLQVGRVFDEGVSLAR